MKTLLLMLLLSFNSFADDGLTIPNSHQVDKSGNVFRGHEPRKQVDELAHFGITDVIIFKNDVKGEVAQEVADLTHLGIRSHHIPFQWEHFKSMAEACEQTVDALNLIADIKAHNGKVFFHCTAGEDRTGMLAGLYRMLEEHLTRDTVFRTEMCPRGYSDGNPKKPRPVTAVIQKELTPLFIALSDKVMRGTWKLGRISKQTCQNLQIAPTTLKCH
jgi:protein-tyrosine phosphatase